MSPSAYECAMALVCSTPPTSDYYHSAWMSRPIATKSLASSAWPPHHYRGARGRRRPRRYGERRRLGYECRHVGLGLDRSAGGLKGSGQPTLVPRQGEVVAGETVIRRSRRDDP